MKARTRKFFRDIQALGTLADALERREAPPKGDWVQVGPGVWKRNPAAAIARKMFNMEPLRTQIANAQHIRNQFKELEKIVNARSRSHS